MGKEESKDESRQGLKELGAEGERCNLWWGQGKNAVWKIPIQCRGLLCALSWPGYLAFSQRKPEYHDYSAPVLPTYFFFHSVLHFSPTHELLFLSFLSECMVPALPSFRLFYSHLDVQFPRCFLFQLSVPPCAWCTDLSKTHYWTWGLLWRPTFLCVCWTPT